MPSLSGRYKWRGLVPDACPVPSFCWKTKPLRTTKFNKDNVLRFDTLLSRETIDTRHPGRPNIPRLFTPGAMISKRNLGRRGRGLNALGWLRTCPDAALDRQAQQVLDGRVPSLLQIAVAQQNARTRMPTSPCFSSLSLSTQDNSIIILSATSHRPPRLDRVAK